MENPDLNEEDLEGNSEHLSDPEKVKELLEPGDDPLCKRSGKDFILQPGDMGCQYYRSTSGKSSRCKYYGHNRYKSKSCLYDNAR